MRHLAIALLMCLSSPVSALAADATSLHGIPIQPPPAGLFAPEGSPGGDTADGIGLFADPATATLVWKRASVTAGPSALSANVALAGQQMNLLAGPPDYANHGFRSGLVAYIPAGVWELEGRLVIAGPTNVEYDVVVMQGHTLSPDPGRSGIVSEQAQPVGGGVSSWTGAAYLPFTIPFSAHAIQFVGDPGQANELSVWVYPKTPGDGGAALAGIAPDSRGGGIPLNFVSTFRVWRSRGR